MDILGHVINAVVVAAAALAVTWAGKERSDALEKRMDQRFDAVDQRFGAVDQRFDAVDRRMDKQFDQIRAEMAVMRSDLTHIALAVGARPQPSAG